MEQKSLEEKISMLEEKVDKLERIEKRRQRIKWIKIGFKLAAYITIIVLVYLGYRYLKRNYLDPYDNFRNGISTKIDGVKNYDYSSIINGLFGN